MKNKKTSHQFLHYYEGITNASETILISMVSNMGKLTGSNRYISQYILTSVNHTSKLIKKLEKNGYLNISMVANQYRTITLTDKCVEITFDPIKRHNPPNENDNPPNENDNLPQSKSLPTPIKIITNKIEDKIEDKIDDVKAELIADIEETEEIFMEPIKKDKLDLHDLQNRLSEPNDYIEELLSKKLSSTID